MRVYVIVGDDKCYEENGRLRTWWMTEGVPVFPMRWLQKAGPIRWCLRKCLEPGSPAPGRGPVLVCGLLGTGPRGRWAASGASCASAAASGPPQVARRWLSSQEHRPPGRRGRGLLKMNKQGLWDSAFVIETKNSFHSWGKFCLKSPPRISICWYLTEPVKPRSSEIPYHEVPGRTPRSGSSTLGVPRTTWLR